MATKDSCRETGNVLKLWILWIFSFFAVTLAIENSDLEIMNHLKKLNKPYVKSIKSPDGDIIDCVLIHLQPAFDNPLLRNHTIQMQPSSYPKGFSINNYKNKKPLTQQWETKGSCPEGTVPIRRTTKEDLLRARSIQSYGRKPTLRIPNVNSPTDGQTNDDFRHEYATRSVWEDQYYGAKAGIGVWNPRVENGYEFSLAQIWIIGGIHDIDLNTIEAGWQVYPNLYGDYQTRLFGFWTRDGYGTTGCYNHDCSGFVQVGRKKVFGASISPVSIYNGKQFKIDLFIFKDPKSGHWWLHYNDEALGYWPNALFTHLQHYASLISWGGEVVNSNIFNHTSTEMGSGQFSHEGYKKTANFIELQVVDSLYATLTPINLRSKVTNSGCYDMRTLTTEHWGEMFYYGGPGRNPKCS